MLLFEDIVRAEKIVSKHIVTTPVVHSKTLSEDIGEQIYLKLENQQITGSFKIDSWKDKNTGEDRYKPVVRVDRLNLLSSRKESENNQYSNNSNSGEIPF